MSFPKRLLSEQRIQNSSKEALSFMRPACGELVGEKTARYCATAS